MNGRDEIAREDVEEADILFVDAKRSAVMLMERESEFLH